MEKFVRKNQKEALKSMLHQLDIYLKNSDISGLYSDLGIKLHGFIMSKIDPRYANLLHTQEPRLFSLFVYDSGNGFVCRISTLNDEAAQILDVLENQDEIVVYTGRKPTMLQVESTARATPINTADIPTILSQNHYTLDIVTPATRKTSGRYSNPPDLSKYFTSVVNKLAAYENISIEHSELEQIFASVKINRYMYESRDFMLSNKKIPAMTGSVDITVKSEPAKLLLGYATYSGIGAKTSLGMGGFLIRM
jgi:CRISPR-associated endoribonuclease Cas6